MDEKLAPQDNFREPPPYEPYADAPPSSSQPESPPTYVFGAAVKMSYVKSVRGLLKIAVIILSLIIAICGGTEASPCYNPSCGPALYVMRIGISAIIFSGALFVLFAFYLTEKIHFIHWPGTDFINVAIYTVLYFVGSCWLAANTLGSASIAAVIFCFVCTVAFGYNTWLSFVECRQLYRERQYRRRHPTQIQTTTTVEVTQTHNVV